MSDRWMDQNGFIACAEHGGHYLAAAVAANPDATRLETPRSDWLRLPNEMCADLGCEICGAQ